MQPNNRNQMHPQDKRNLIIFIVVCFGLFFAYNQFIYKPRLEVLRQKHAAEKAVIDAPALNDAAAQVAAPVTTDEARTAAPRIAIDSHTLHGSFLLKGGRIDDLVLKNYHQTVQKTDPVPLFAPARTEYPQYAEFGWLAGDAATAVPGRDTVWRKVSGDTLTATSPVVLEWSNGAGLTFRRTIALDHEYMFSITDSVTNNGAAEVSLFPYALVARLGLPHEMNASAIIHEGPLAYIDGELREGSFRKLPKGDDTLDAKASNGWIGITEKYWLAALIPAGDGAGRYRFSAEEMDADKHRFQSEYTGEAVTLAPGAKAEETIHMFAGPKIVSMLEAYEDKYAIPHFDLAVDFGIFYFLTRPFFTILTWIGHTTGSFAMAILIFTVLLRICVFPLANKSFRSFARMRKLNPQLIELREKFGDDRQRLQKEIFELYQRENVNPMAGCLPILVQIPIFFSLYKVLYVSIEMRQAPFWGWISDMSVKDPTTIFNLFGLIPWEPSIMVGAWPCLMCVTLLLQQRLNPPPQDPVQAKLMMFMPFMVTWILSKFPAGLVIYWTWSNLLSMVQQYVLMRSEGVDVFIFRRSPQEKKLEEMVEHGPAGVSPAAEMVEEEIEHLVEGNEGDITPTLGAQEAEDAAEKKTSVKKAKAGGKAKAPKKSASARKTPKGGKKKS